MNDTDSQLRATTVRVQQQNELPRGIGTLSVIRYSFVSMLKYNNRGR